MRILIKRNGEVVVHEQGEDDRIADRNDPFNALTWFRARVEFEEGLTAFQMMRALKPWSRALSAAGWIDFDAWFSAMSLPMVREADEGEVDRLSGLELHPVAYVNRDEEDGERTASVSVAWRPLGRYATPQAGPGGHMDDHCSISFLDPRMIGHLPISICTTLRVQDIRVMRPWGEDPVLPEAVPGVYDRLVEHPSFFDAVVLGFLDDISFHGSPEETGDVSSGLLKSIEEIRSAEVAGDAPVSKSNLRDLLAEFGVEVEEEENRANLGRRIAEAASGLVPEAAAEALGLTLVGLEALAGGRIAGFSTGTLEVFAAKLENLKRADAEH